MTYVSKRGKKINCLYIVTLYANHQFGFPTSKTTFYGEVLRMNVVRQSVEEKLLCGLAAEYCCIDRQQQNNWLLMCHYMWPCYHAISCRHNITQEC